MLDDALWWSSYGLLIAANNLLLMKLFTTVNYNGICLTAQFGFFIAHLQHFYDAYHHVGEKMEGLMMLSAVGPITSMIFFTLYDLPISLKYDTIRVEEYMASVASLTSAVILNTPFVSLGRSWYLFLEVLAVIAQLRYTESARCVDVWNLRYCLCLIAYKVLQMGYWMRSDPSDHVQLVAGTLYVFYCMCIVGRYGAPIGVQININDVQVDEDNDDIDADEITIENEFTSSS